jgi:dTDP-4-amino-4,6-dideoxygalactose transaminase
LVRAGIGATASYPKALIDVPEIRPHVAERTADTPRARQVAAGILTLPTHAFVTRSDLDRMGAIVRTG